MSPENFKKFINRPVKKRKLKNWERSALSGYYLASKDETATKRQLSRKIRKLTSVLKELIDWNDRDYSTCDDLYPVIKKAKKVLNSL